MIDREVVLIRIAAIQDRVKLLRKIKATSAEQLASDPMKLSASERLVQVSMQSVIDISSHIVAALHAQMPKELRDLPETLKKLGILPPDLASELSSMIGMRNILVHQYIDIDVYKLHDVIENHLGDFDEFIRYIVAYMEKEGLT